MGIVLDRTSAGQYCQRLRDEGKRLVLTNGLFDLLHVGHVTYLEQARKLGDTLLVGLNSDQSARALKGDGHPIIVEKDRARVLAAMRAVDAVVVFDDLTADHLLQLVRPDIYVKGGDYADKPWPERRTAESLGCQVKLIPFTKGYSTSDLVQRVIDRFGSHDSSHR